MALLKKSLGKTGLVKAFEDIFVLEETENLNYPVNALVQLAFALQSFEVRLEHLVEVADQRARHLVVLVANSLEGHLHRKVDLSVAACSA